MKDKTIRPLYGITRLDRRFTRGYKVELLHKFRGWFPDKKFRGSKKAALRAAQKFRDQLLEENPEIRDQAISRREDIPQSGVPGVTHIVQETTTGLAYYWRAVYLVESGPRKGLKSTKNFRVGPEDQGEALEEAKAFMEGRTPIWGRGSKAPENPEKPHKKDKVPNPFSLLP